MQTKGLIAALSQFAIILLSVSCGEKKQEKSKDPGVASLIEVKIGGMTCTGCEQTIQIREAITGSGYVVKNFATANP